MRSCHDHLWYAWIYVLGSSKVADQYQCEVTLENLENTGESFTFKGQPHSLDKSGQQVILTSGTLMMTDSIIKNMYKEMENDQKQPGEEDQLKFLLCIKYKVNKICQIDE